MEAQPSVDEVVALERRLLDPAVRADRKEVEHLLHDEFIEILDARCADDPSAADDGVCLDLYEPAGIQEPLDDDEARGRPDPAEGLAVHPRDSVTVGRIDEEHTRSHYVTKRRAGLAKRLVDDLHASSSLHTDIRVDVAVRRDRSGGGNEDEMLVADSPAEADGRLERRA